MALITYLGRPVFPRPVNWAHDAAETVEAQSNTLQLGHVPPRIERQNIHSQRAWSFEIWLQGEAAIIEFEDFTETVSGQLTGFWLEEPRALCRIFGNVTTKQNIIVRSEGNLLTEDPSQYLVFSPPPGSDGPTQYAKISHVSEEPHGVDIITLEDDLVEPINDRWECRRLLYVRFLDAPEEATYYLPHFQRRVIKVIELPLEYEDTQPGERHTFLYEFMMTTNTGKHYWRYTSFDQNIRTTGAVDWSATAITHRGHTRSIRESDGTFEIRAIHEPTMVLSQFFPTKLQRTLWLTVYEIAYASPNARETIFSGALENIHLTGKSLIAEFSAFHEVVARRFPGFMIQNRCNYFVYSPACGVSKGLYTKSAKIVKIQNRSLTVESSALKDFLDQQPAGFRYNYFALGWIETGGADKFEIRQIETSSQADANNQVTLKLSSKLEFALVDQSVTLTAGCDGSKKVCNGKFDNFRRWGGHNQAFTNLAVKAMDAEISVGNKK